MKPVVRRPIRRCAAAVAREVRYMRGPVPTSGAFWAKLKRDESGEVVAWHPFADHGVDVALAAELLLSLPAWNQRLSRLAGRPLEEVDVARLAFVAGLHDVGKLARRFQDRAWRDGPGGHTMPGLEALKAAMEEEGPAARVAPVLASWGGAGAAAAWWAAICHHGRLVGDTEVTSSPHDFRRDWSPREQGDPAEALDQLTELLWRAFPVAGQPAPDLPEAPAFHHAFAGLVMLADWLGSDTALCPYREHEQEERIEAVRARLRRHAQASSLDPRPWRHRLPSAVTFDDLIGGKGWVPRGVQSVVADLPLPSERGSIGLIEAETGSGKTEAALLWWARLYRAGLVDGLYFALPLRAAATQLHRRVKEAVGALFGEDAPPVTLAVPGYLRVDDLEGRPLPDFQVLWNDQPSPHGRGIRDPRTWAAERPKRYLAAAIAVGTIDQVLLSAIKVPHAHLRGTAALRHLLVVDEVHATDRYMERILVEVLDRFRAAGGHALLLSATLGERARRRLFRQRPVPLPAATDTPYPRVWMSQDGHLEPHEAPKALGEREKVVEVRLSSDGEQPEQIAALAVDAVRRGAKVLVIVNRVDRCQAVHAEAERLLGGAASDLLLSVDGVCAPHHSRYARADRELLDRAVEDRFGKESGPGAVLAVATQTVEQSLDIDADLLVTDLCPMDVLLQRIGRLHRHRARGVAPCVVLSPSEPDLVELARRQAGGVRRGHPSGLGTVYRDLCGLIATRRLIASRPQWRLPRDNRELVELATHDEALHAIGHEDEVLAAALQREIGEGAGKHSIAVLRVLDWEREIWERGFPSRDGGRQERTGTRWDDGEDDRLAPVEPPWTSPLGGVVKELRVEGYWCRGADPAVVGQEADRLLLQVGDRRVTYTRTGLSVVGAQES